MYLCNFCRKGQLEMCEYFKAHFLEKEGYVAECPEYDPDPDAEADEMEGIL